MKTVVWVLLIVFVLLSEDSTFTFCQRPPDIAEIGKDLVCGVQIKDDVHFFRHVVRTTPWCSKAWVLVYRVTGLDTVRLDSLPVEVECVKQRVYRWPNADTMEY